MSMPTWMLDLLGSPPSSIPPNPSATRSKNKPVPTPSELVLLAAFESRGYVMESNVKLHGYYPDLRVAGTNILIEVDGSIHKLPEVKARDKERSKNLREHGYRIVRCTNKQVAKDPYKIVDKVATILATALHKKRK